MNLLDRRTTVPTKKSVGKKRTKLPKSATITISHGKPIPPDKADVTPKAGRVHFKNNDRSDHRLRFWRRGTNPNRGIDILLPAGGTTTVVIRLKDEFNYGVMTIQNARVRAMYGPIKN
jgi:hypothetical protein